MFNKVMSDHLQRSWVFAGVAVVGGVAKIVSRSNANKKMRKLQEENEANRYVENPLARQRLGLANTLLNARMPGAAAAERNIQTAGANTLANNNRNVTSGSQALALSSAVQGQQGQDYNNLAQMENQDYQRRLVNKERAEEGVINEMDKVHGDGQRIFGDKVNMQAAINQNQQNSWSDVSNMGYSMANFSGNGGFSSGMGQSFWGSGGGGGGGNMGQGIYNMQRTTAFNPQTQSYRNG